jgi:DNA-binding transcriptional regulator YdaS (Cro superfamily)
MILQYRFKSLVNALVIAAAKKRVGLFAIRPEAVDGFASGSSATAALRRCKVVVRQTFGQQLCNAIIPLRRARA